MKKFILSLSAIAFFACGTPESAKKEDGKTTSQDSITKPKEAEPKKCDFVYDAANTIIEFGAFKTTAKTEVMGAFESFDVLNTKVGTDAKEVFNEATFVVYINSLETKNAGRNTRIKENFFYSLTTPESLSGKVISIEGDSIKIALTMNGISKDVMLNYSQTENEVALSGTINVLNWNANKGLAALNKACENLHRGADGISKTWADVNLYISSTVKEKCN
jgi:hypothetical protein